MRRRTRATLVGGALTILGACTRLDTAATLDGAITTSPAGPADTAPDTTAPSATVPAAPPSTVAATVHGTGGADTTEANLRADVVSTWEVAHQCAATPEQCDLAAVAVAGSDAEAQLQDRIDQLVLERFRAVPGSGPLELTIESATVVDAATAVVVACVTDGVVLVDIANPEDPNDDIVFDDSLGSYRWRWEMTRTAAGWRRHGVELLGYFPWTATCPAA